MDHRDMLGLKKNLNILVDYDPSWEIAFIEERKRLARVLGEVAQDMEHDGSTAVPGMRAADAAVRASWNLEHPIRRRRDLPKSVRLAYAHGEVDHPTTPPLGLTFVSKVTNEIVLIEGEVTPIGPLTSGIVDRRTGHAGFTHYLIGDSPNGKWKDTKKFWQQYAFGCEPSKPAKF